MEAVQEVIPVILGAGGMLGAEVCDVLGAAHANTVCATRDEIDLTDYWGMRWDLERLGATTIVNCAAFTDVDGCESKGGKAKQINTEGAGNLARACHEVGARLIHISTDFVFDGKSDRPYREQDPTGPISAYGDSKLEGEHAVATASPEAVILRCSWLYGPRGRNFISTILGIARRGEPLKIVDDQFGTPTYTADLARGIVRLMNVEHSGLLHFANTGVCSRLEFASEALRLAGLERIPVEAVRSEDLERPARRPAYSALDPGLFTELTGQAPRPWQETLPDYLEAVA